MNKTNITLPGFILFFVTILFTSTASIFVYYISTAASNGNILIVSISVLSIIILGAILCTLSDLIRRKIMVETPVNIILEATERIANGDFTVEINTINPYNKYNEYDLILENIAKMAKELSKNEVLKNDFISNVSHEIKTPLSVIQNYAKSLNNKKLSEEKKSEYVQILINQTNKLSTLITNILKLNKLENQTILPNKDTINIGELLRENILQFEEILDSKNITLDCKITDIEMNVEPSYIEIIFNNLISNAIKFTDNNGKIDISLQINNEYIVFKVKDNGCGMSKDVGDHIFEKFYQGDTSHSKEGNGLGLALVKKVIDILGGKIDIESQINKGSTFTIHLKRNI